MPCDATAPVSVSPLRLTLPPISVNVGDDRLLKDEVENSSSPLLVDNNRPTSEWPMPADDAKKSPGKFSLLLLDANSAVATEGLKRPATTKITIRIGQAIEGRHKTAADDDDHGEEEDDYGADEKQLNVAAIMGVSKHGRVRKPSAWITEASNDQGDYGRWEVFALYMLLLFSLPVVVAVGGGSERSLAEASSPDRSGARPWHADGQEDSAADGAVGRAAGGTGHGRTLEAAPETAETPAQGAEERADAAVHCRRCCHCC